MACLDGQYPTRVPTEQEAGRAALDDFVPAPVAGASP
jgi:hypothetical protein